MHYKHLWGALGLALFFMVPFGLRFQSNALEPYPSILFPSGAGWLVLENNHFPIQYEMVFGLDAETQEYKELETVPFMEPIPKQYFYQVVGKRFGLDARLKKTEYYRWSEPIVKMPFSEVSESEVLVAKAWVRERLRAQGCVDDHIKIARVEARVQRPKEGLRDIKLSNEEIIDLR